MSPELRASAISFSSFEMRSCAAAGTGASTEKTWFTSANYALPRFFRFYGSYNTRTEDAPGTKTSEDTTIFGVNFSHSIGKLVMGSRYEKRYDGTNTNTGGAATLTKNTSDNVDWLMSLYLSSFLNTGVSESYVLNTSDGQSTSSNTYRFKVGFGPVRNFTVGPYMDYVVSSTSSGPSTTTLDYNVPAMYTLNLHRKIGLSFMDNYRWSTTTTPPTSTTSSSNTITARMLYAGPFPNTSLEGDATFASSTASGSPTTTTTTYAARADWRKSIHTINANYTYQTGSNTVPSYSFAVQYGLAARIKNLSMSLQARYGYSATESSPKSAAQSVYMTLTIRK